MKPILAYYDSLTAGLVPVKVTCICAGAYGREATMTVMADRRGYKRGEQFTGSTLFVVPRDAIRRRKYGTYIKAHKPIGSE